MILVTGATGRVGYRLMEALADAGADATAMVRVEARAADLPGAPRHVVASFDDPPPAETLREFGRVFLLSPAHEEQATLETVFIDALAAAGHHPHIVKIAADGFQDPDCEVRFMRSHRQVAMHLEALGLDRPVSLIASLNRWRCRRRVLGRAPAPYSRTTLRTVSSGSTTAIWFPSAFSSSRNFQTAIARRMPSLMESPLRSISALKISVVSKLRLTDKRTKRFLPGFSPGDLSVAVG